MSATNQLKELLQMPGFGSAMTTSQSQRSGGQYNAVSELNDLNTCIAPNSAGVHHSLPNNQTIRVDSSSGKSLLTITAPKAAVEGHESTNSDFTKIERLVDFNWEMSRNCNWIAVNNRKPLIAYVINRRQPTPKASNVPLNGNAGNQMIRIMQYETRTRCLARGVFHEAIADLSFAVNSVSSNSLDISKLAVADKGGNVYIYSLKEENGEISAQQVLAIQNDGRKFESVRLSWCPYIPSEDDDTPVERDPGLILALSCDTRLEVFAIDLLQSKYKEAIVVEIQNLRESTEGYQIIENAHDRSITSMSIAEEATAICTTGLDDKIRFYSVDLNHQKTSPKVFLKEWDLRNEYQYYEKDDHIQNFFFLDDFDSLLSQTDPIFWGYGLLCTRKGHIAIVNLKDWRSKQAIKLTTEESAQSQEDFSYRIDLTAHHVLAIRGHEAFLLHIHFPHDKEEVYDDCEPLNNIGSAFDNLYPYISKVTRFQLYSSPLRSFAVKKAIDDKVLLFWITGQSLELCTIDLSSITIEEGVIDNYSTFDMNADKMMDNIGNATALNNMNTEMSTAINIPNKDLDLMTDTLSNPCMPLNGFDDFDISSLLKPLSNTSEPLPPIPLPKRKTPEPVVSSLNLLPQPPAKFTQSMSEEIHPPFMPPLPRPESPASKEVQQIFNPPAPPLSAANTLSSIQALFSKNTVQPMNNDFGTPFAELSGALFPSKLPNILKDMVKEEQILQLKSDLFKEIQDSESRVLRVVERVDQKMNLKMNSNNEQLLNNSKAQTNKIETDIREMKKELKNACKIRNEEFNKIVEKLVNRVMHEMNLIVQKGFTELMNGVDKEFKRMTKEFDKQIHTIETKISEAAEKNTTHFQSLALATPVTPNTPHTPLIPQQTQQQITYTPTGIIAQRKTPQPLIGTPHPMATTPLGIHSAASTPVPFSAPRHRMTPSESELPAMGQSHWQIANAVANAMSDQKQQQQLLLQQQQKQKQEIQNEIWRNVGTGHLNQAITKALNMRDPDMVVKICELFKGNPSQLIDQIKADQTVLISLLQQIIFNRTNNNLTEESYWKTGYIEQIMTNLDLQNECVIKILPSLAPKIVQLLDVIANSATDAAIVSKARILAFSFKHLKL